MSPTSSTMGRKYNEYLKSNNLKRLKYTSGAAENQRKHVVDFYLIEDAGHASINVRFSELIRSVSSAPSRRSRWQLSRSCP